MFVSEICLGTMTFGNSNSMWGSIAGLEQHEVNQIMERALAAGINFIDTADVYSIGQSEKLLGQSLKDLGIHRKDVVIATKVHGPMGAGPNDRSEEHTSELQSLMRITYAVFCLKKKKNTDTV